jgi:hypothetical protein
MCPRDTLTRKREFMEFGLFEKIINAGLDTIEYKGNLEWAGVVRDQKELWEARL